MRNYLLQRYKKLYNNKMQFKYIGPAGIDIPTSISMEFSSVLIISL